MTREQPTRTKKARPGISTPWLPLTPILAVTVALQALARGEADGQQQKLALDWIIKEAAGAYDMAFWPGIDGQRNTDFALGRQFVGYQIVKELSLSVMDLKRQEPNADAAEPKS